jgi:oxygen-independent coproporphyrinogen-3 oxidase
VHALKEELIQRTGGEYVRSVYFGGGTPSLLSAEQISDILSTIYSLFTVGEAVEITIEANPGTINKAYLIETRAAGVNRLSLGVQSLNGGELALLGRIHTASEAIDSIRFARDSGFDNLNIDIIYGLPGQTIEDWQNTLDEVTKIGPEHLSLYALSIETDTPIYCAIENGYLPYVDPDLSADQYELAEDLLDSGGYNHYEISNWASKGRECYHNIGYWQNLPYMGVGVAAHSFLNGRRTANTYSIDRYLAAFANNLQPEQESDEEISPDLQLAETVILGLRLCDGVCLDDIGSRFGRDLPLYYDQCIEELTGFGLLERRDRRIKLTRRGRLLSNEVLWRFLPD